MLLNRKQFSLIIRSSFWYLPLFYGFTAFIAALISRQVDHFLHLHPMYYRYIPSMFLCDIDLAKTVLSSIATSLLTMTTITFSSIMIVLTTYLSQFSPRTLQDFITDHQTQRVLGIFAGGFIYSIILLLLLRDETGTSVFLVPTFAVTIAVICLIVFVFFIHHVSSWIQVSNLIHHITTKTLEAINDQFVDKHIVHQDPPWEDWESAEIVHKTPVQIHSTKSGYLQFINIPSLIKHAQQKDVIVKIEKELGEYVDKNSLLFSVWNINVGESNKAQDTFTPFLSIGKQRAPLQDVDFGITKIVEIALRALSPGINDPNTAISCINELGKILGGLGQKHLPRPYYNDGDRSLRVIMNHPNYERYLYKSFYQLRHYSAGDVSVLASILDALQRIAEVNESDIKHVVWSFTQYIKEGINQQQLVQLDKDYLNEKLQAIAISSGHPKEFLPLK
jgi:uncharacterized membrane protein